MLTAIAVATLAILPTAQQQQQRAMEILSTAARMEGERQANVSNYVIIQTVQMMQAPAYYEKTDIDGLSLFRLVPISEWQRRRTGMTAEESSQMASGMAMGIDMLAAGFRDQLGGTGGITSIPGGAMVSGYMTSMMSDMSTFARAAAEAESHISDGRTGASEQRRGLEMFAQRARLVGTETVAGRSAFHLLADDLSDVPIEQPSGGGEVKMVDANMWIDDSAFVPVRLLMHMVMEHDGKKVPLSIEMLQLDYKQKGSLYMATRQVMRMSGLMEAMATSPKERQKLEKARREAEKLQAQMANMDEQMADVPASMKGMVKKQVDKAMKQLEMLTSDGVFEAEIGFKIYSINEGPPYDWIPKPGSGDE